MDKFDDINFYIIKIISILNDIKHDEDVYNEGSLTSDDFIMIIDYLLKIKNRGGEK